MSEHEQVQGDGNSVDFAAQQTSPSVTLRLPPSPLTGLTVTGTGTGNRASIECDPPAPPGLMISMNFRLFISEGTANRTYFFRNSDYDDKHRVIMMMMKLLSLACLSDSHEYCIHTFAGGTGCQCNCHPENRR